MKKLFGLFLLALACWAPDVAQAANRWAVCATTCTWDNTSTAMWSSVGSGGATGASAPVAGDDVILDGATCVGGTTCTITTFAGTISAASITWGACTASTTGCIIAANTNNTNFTLSSSTAFVFSGTGTGTRKWTAGTGTYALTSTNAFNGCFTMATITNDQGSTFNSATWTCSGTIGNNNPRSWNGGGFSFGPTTFNANTSRGSMQISGTNTFSSLTIGAPNNIVLSATQTISGSLTISGSSSSNPINISANSIDGAQTLSLGSASSADWLTIRGITLSGVGVLSATNCLNLGYVTLNGGTCAAPAGGGGGGGRIIGG